MFEEFIKRYPFGLFQTQKQDEIHTSSVVCDIKKENNALVLYAHFPKVNEHWKTGLTKADIVFQGPQMFVTPEMYSFEDGLPTWNYALIKARVQVEILEDVSLIKEHLGEIYLKLKALGNSAPQLYDLPGKKVQSLLSQLLLMRMPVKDLEAAINWGADKPAIDRKNLIEKYYDSKPNPSNRQFHESISSL